MTSPKLPGIADRVPADSPGAREIGFAIPPTYNASRILFDNLGKGRGDRPALTGPLGARSYFELCAEASQWGHGFISLGLKRGDRILMFLDDSPAYPAAFFGAVRAGFVPLLINTLSRPGRSRLRILAGTVIASEAKQSIYPIRGSGLLRRFAPRNDEPYPSSPVPP